MNPMLIYALADNPELIYPIWNFQLPAIYILMSLIYGIKGNLPYNNLMNE